MPGYKIKLTSFLQVGFLIFIIYIPFALTFPKFIHPPANTTCAEDFSSDSTLFYSTFVMILNMGNLKSVANTHPAGLYMLHITYGCILGVLMLNFLIAILSTSYALIADNKEIIGQVQWLSIASSILFRLPESLRRYYAKMSSRGFVEENGRIFLVYTTTNLELLNKKGRNAVNDTRCSLI